MPSQSRTIEAVAAAAGRPASAAAPSSTDDGPPPPPATAPVRCGGGDPSRGRGGRPDMTALRCMLQRGMWDAVRDAVRRDPTVSVRVDDSPEEDRWFDEARRRRRRGARGTGGGGGADDDAPAERPRGGEGSNARDDDDAAAAPMPLRYWVSNNGAVDERTRALLDVRRRRTLLLSLCRMRFPSNDALVVQLRNGDTDGLVRLTGAVATARELIAASHNRRVPPAAVGGDDEKKEVDADDDDDGGGVGVGVERRGGASADASAPREDDDDDDDCRPSDFRRRYRRCPPVAYCPPVALPPVERERPAAAPASHEEEEGEDPDEMVLHTSVLTMTDSMGETPLHSLTGFGSCHVDLIEAFLEGCRPSSGDDDDASGGGARDDGGDRRPTVRDLLAARNFHGCTPLHFLADGENEEGLRLVLDACRVRDAPPPPGTIHPAMIPDDEGDLPLHFAACNGASSSLLRALTTAAGEASLVRNSSGRLPVDDFVERYVERMSVDDDAEREGSEGDDASSATGSEGDSDGSGDASSSSSGDSSVGEASGGASNDACPNDVGRPERHVSRNFGFLSSTANWENELWDPIWVLIEAAATSIRNSMCSEHPVGENAWLPIHAAVVATKYAGFPAMALVASVLRSGGCDAASGGTNDENSNPVGRRMLERDSFGCLPLHLACGGGMRSLPSAPAAGHAAGEGMHGARREAGTNATNSIPGETRDRIDPGTTTSRTLVRWNTKDLPCSMIEYLVRSEPSAARVPTRHGRLPLHLLVKEDRCSPAHTPIRDEESIRQPWDDVVAILKEHPDALVTPDAISHLYPFQLAAASSDPLPHNETQPCTSDSQRGLLSLENTYRLIMEDPSLLFQLIEE